MIVMYDSEWYYPGHTKTTCLHVVCNQIANSCTHTANFNSFLRLNHKSSSWELPVVSVTQSNFSMSIYSGVGCPLQASSFTIILKLLSFLLLLWVDWKSRFMQKYQTHLRRSSLGSHWEAFCPVFQLLLVVTQGLRKRDRAFSAESFILTHIAAFNIYFSLSLRSAPCGSL